MLPFSKIQLVVFSGVLILPALESGGFLFGSEIYDDCDDILTECGDMICRLQGSGDFHDYHPKLCIVECTGHARPKFPDGICFGNGVNCTPFVRESLLNWKHGLQRTLNGVLAKWCSGCSKK
uniref:Putative ixodes 10 kDa peptide protein n=1 Tax=Ixodes ricinus TaxID=34613 RepID=A0A0K8RDB0_IXORI